MGDYPDPEEEYELMYADELEMLKENEEEEDPNIVQRKPLPAKRSLDFSSPLAEKSKLVKNNRLHQEDPIILSQTSLSSQPLDLDEIITNSNSTTNKRTAEDLFGDIGDIDFNELDLPSKRQKTEEETDLELINKILEGRKLKQLLFEPSNRAVDFKANYSYEDNISLDIPKWPFIPLTNSDGDRMYIKLDSEEKWESSLDMAIGTPTFKETYASAWEEARKILDAKQQKLINSEAQASTQPLPDVDSYSIDENCNILWLDRFKPKTYVDLLTEEPVNRAVLHWLHLWDKVVFKKEIKTKEPQQRNTFNKRVGQFQFANRWRGKNETEPELDDTGRPQQKVVLLSGPPGVGKTTLAHLLAKQAGYRPVELNASDDRSSEAFRTALQNATQMRSVIDADKRPNCLILDEIDGAPLPTIELLVRWCTASVESGKKKSKTHPLKRPVIAICNDLYTPALRPLRHVALTIQVSHIAASRLTQLLNKVAQQGEIRCGSDVCSTLARRANGDVRRAILALYTPSREGDKLTMETIDKLDLFSKDCNKTVMQALSSIFTLNERGYKETVKCVQAAGEYERIADGVFENYVLTRSDARMLIACETLKWLRFYDAINSWTLRCQNYSLYGAFSLSLAATYTALASRTSTKLKFPSQGFEMSRRKAELDSITTSVLRGSKPAAISPGALKLDLLPLLPYLLSPALRSANVQLCSENERKALTTCAGAMCDYGLQYTQQRTQDGLYAFVLEPDIYKVAFFGNEERLRPTPPVRQAIAREQQMEVLKRNEEMANRMSNSQPNTERTTKKPTGKIVASVDKDSKPLPNHLQRLQPIEVQKIENQVHKDFFGRIVPLSQVQKSDGLPDVISSSRVFFQYREGFNNAVRRNVRVKDLL